MSGESIEYDEQLKKSLAYLKRYKVKIPFADKIVGFFPSKRINERRNLERFFDFIKSVTCFHQYQREIEGEYLISELSDYDKARDIFMNIQQGVGSIPLNTRQKDIVNAVKKGTEGLGLAEIHSRLKEYISLQNLRPHVESLVNLRVLDKFFDKDTNNREIIKYRIGEEYTSFDPIILPNSLQLFTKRDSNDSNDSNGTNMVT